MLRFWQPDIRSGFVRRLFYQIDIFSARQGDDIFKKYMAVYAIFLCVSELPSEEKHGIVLKEEKRLTGSCRHMQIGAGSD